MIHFFTQAVPLWKVFCVAAPVLFVVHSIFHSRKFCNRLFIPPVLSLVLIVGILYFVSASGGKGPVKGEKKGDSPVPTQEVNGSPPDSPGDVSGGGTSPPPQNSIPVNLEIRFLKEKGTFRFLYAGKACEVRNPDEQLKEMRGSGYEFTSIEVFDFTLADRESLQKTVSILQPEPVCTIKTRRNAE